MTSVGTLFVDLKSNTRGFDAGIKGAQANLDSLANSLKGIGIAAGIAATGLLVLGRAVSKVAASFELAIVSAGAVANVLDSTTGEFENMRSKALESAAATQFTARQVAGAMEIMAQAGFSAKEVIGGIDGVLELAAAASVSLAQATDIAAGTLRGFGLEVGELSRVNDVLLKTSQSANVNLSDLQESLKFAAPIAASAGFSLEATAAIIGKMGDKMSKGGQAGTSFKNAIVRLLTPTRQVREGLKDVGVSLVDSSGKMKGFTQIIRDLEPHAKNTGALMKIFGKFAGPALVGLVAQGADAIEDLSIKLATDVGVAARTAQKKMETFAGSVLVLESAFEGFQIRLGDIVNVGFAPLVAMVKKAFNAFEELEDSTIEFMVAAVGVVGVVLTVVAGLAAMVLVGAKVVAAIAGIPAMLGAIGAAVVGLAGTIATSLAPALPAIAAITIAIGTLWALIELGKILWEIWGDVAGSALRDLNIAIRKFAEDFGAFLIFSFEEAASSLREIFDPAIEYLRGRLGELSDFFGGVFTGVWEFFGTAAQFWINEVAKGFSWLGNWARTILIEGIASAFGVSLPVAEKFLNQLNMGIAAVAKGFIDVFKTAFAFWRDNIKVIVGWLETAGTFWAEKLGITITGAEDLIDASAVITAKIELDKAALDKAAADATRRLQAALQFGGGAPVAPKGKGTGDGTGAVVPVGVGAKEDTRSTAEILAASGLGPLGEASEGAQKGLAALGSELAQGALAKAGGLGEVMQAAFAGFETAGPAGAVVAGIVTALAQTESGQEAIAMVGELFGKLLQAISPLVIMLLPLIELIGNVLTPAFQLVGSVLAGVAVVVLNIFLALASVWNGIISAIQGLLRTIDKVIPGDKLEDLADKFEKAKIPTESLEEAMAEAVRIVSMGFTPATEDATNELNGMNEALLNVPSGFKIALARFNATNIAQGVPFATSGDATQGFSQSTIAINQVTVVTDDPEEFVAQLELLERERRLINTGVGELSFRRKLTPNTAPARRF